MITHFSIVDQTDFYLFPNHVELKHKLAAVQLLEVQIDYQNINLFNTFSYQGGHKVVFD